VKQVLVISGKGGTGKTSLVAALAHLAAPLVLADCDVDAADLHLLACANETEGRSQPFTTGSLPKVNEELCTGCGACATLCRFEAMSMVDHDGGWLAQLDPFACEGCGVCVDHCPYGALSEEERTAGELLTVPSRFGTLVYGRLLPGLPNSGKLVTLVRTRAKAKAGELGAELVLVDGPPGIGCPVIASLSGVDLALAVTEPTPTALHDLRRLLELCRRFQVAAAVVLNKADLDPAQAGELERLLSAEDVPLLGRIDYSEAFTHALAQGRTIVETEPDGAAAKAVLKLQERLSALLAEQG
jgi:MinD superfamily P-loop ATPase